MMTRVQLLLTPEQDRRLEQLAARKHESKAKLIRRALDLLFRTEPADHEPLLDLIGQAGRSGRRDISKDHDRVLLAAERERNRQR